MSIIVYNEVSEPIVPTPGELLILGLFARGELGGAWDFTSPDHLYQDAGGATPVTSFGNPIGLAMDLSPNGNHLRQQTTAARPTFTADGALHDGVDDFLMAASEADWTFLHDGTGGTMGASSVYLGQEGDGSGRYGTQGAGSTSIGITMGIQSHSLARSSIRLRGQNETISPGTSPTGSMPVGVAVAEVVEHADERLRGWLNKDIFVDMPYDGFIPSSDEPFYPFNTNTTPHTHSLCRRRMVAINRKLTGAELSLIHNWLMEGVE